MSSQRGEARLKVAISTGLRARSNVVISTGRGEVEGCYLDGLKGEARSKVVISTGSRARSKVVISTGSRARSKVVISTGSRARSRRVCRSCRFEGRGRGRGYSRFRTGISFLRTGTNILREKFASGFSIGTTRLIARRKRGRVIGSEEGAKPKKKVYPTITGGTAR